LKIEELKARIVIKDELALQDMSNGKRSVVSALVQQFL
jgi:hypothetical protein